jgi:hypothetical protein
MRKTKEMFQTFKQAWGKSIQNVISIANEISAPKVEEALKVVTEIKPQSEVLTKLILDPTPQIIPVVSVPSAPIPAPISVAPPVHVEKKIVQPILEPKLVKISRVISTQTLEPMEPMTKEKIQTNLEPRVEPRVELKVEHAECKPEKEVISLDYHWNVLKLMFLMHVISLIIMALLFFKK